MATKIPREDGSSGSKQPADLQELLKKLVLKDEELDNVVLPLEDFMNLREGARWMAVVKVHTTKQFGSAAGTYDGIVYPNTVILDRMMVWVQIRGIPPLFRTEAIVKDMAARIGEVKSVDLYTLGASGTRFVWVRVKIDVNNSLNRVVGLHLEGDKKMAFMVMYEKLPRVL
ncbi:hypothetical protein QYE76_060806 [Lolium multiflorum]|uniref:Uncharacterized protein n=1 Tax=Lolium multiflorum TaxID=4521 RepID=A0AAD8S0W7_LOLMU|nr:hypothetical protein QYE76_060806 [Lolium multiflorum]